MDEQETINSLLDVEHFYGQSQGRVAPVIITLICLAIPPIIYVRYSVFRILPLKIAIPLYVVYAIRHVLIILLDEKTKLENYKNSLQSKYDSSDEIISMRNIESDGCLHYLNGTVAYGIVGYNGTILNKVQHSKNLRNFLEQILGNHEFTVLIQNVTELDTLTNRYKQLKLQKDPRAFEAMLGILEHIKKLVSSKSRLTRIVIIVFGQHEEKAELKETLNEACTSGFSKAFKIVHLATYLDMIDICSNDTDCYIDFNTTLMRRFATTNYRDSKVLYYDNPTKKASKETVIDTQGFMRKDVKM